MSTRLNQAVVRLLATSVMTIVWVTPLAAQGPQLLSIIDLPLSRGEYISSFELRTWTVRVLAVCHVPVGWTVTAGTFGDPGGILSGQANIGVAYLPTDKAGALHALFLVEIGQDKPADVIDSNSEIKPATFTGSITIGRYGPELTERNVALSVYNLAHRRATRCPAAKR